MKMKFRDDVRVVKMSEDLIIAAGDYLVIGLNTDFVSSIAENDLKKWFVEIEDQPLPMPKITGSFKDNAVPDNKSATVKSVAPKKTRASKRNSNNRVVIGVNFTLDNEPFMQVLNLFKADSKGNRYSWSVKKAAQELRADIVSTRKNMMILARRRLVEAKTSSLRSQDDIEYEITKKGITLLNKGKNATQKIIEVLAKKANTGDTSSVREISNETGVMRSTVQTLLLRMVHYGYVKDIKWEDGKEIFYSLSEKGAKALKLKVGEE